MPSMPRSARLAARRSARRLSGARRAALSRGDAVEMRILEGVAGRGDGAVETALSRLSVAADHGRLWMAVAAALGVSGRPRWRSAGVHGLCAMALTSAVANLPAKRLVRRPRPATGLVATARARVRRPASSSFPSGHTASAFAFATAAGLQAPELAAPLLVLAGAVGLSRVSARVHYPADVVAGAALGAALATLCTRVTARMRGAG